MNRQIALQSPVQIFIQKKTHLGRKQCMLPRFFKESDDLLALYAGKSLEKLLDRIARFQMIEKTLHWDASSSKNGLSAKNLRACDTTLLTITRIPYQLDCRKIDLLLPSTALNNNYLSYT
jgi:hypothetical protein